LRSVGVPTSQPCIVCASPNIVPILEIPAIPTDTIRLWSSLAAACSALKARMGLTYCEDCGHLFNRHYDNDLVDYETDYENSQMFSPRFRRYAEELSDRLITTYHLHQKDIVEIGGGRGDFLRIICDRGNNNGVSFGPSYRPAAGDSVPVNVRFVTDYYTAKYAAAPANLIVCRHVLEHFWEPRTLIDTVRQAVGDRKDLVVYFEVPNGEFILREQMFWEIIFQHPSYFTQSSLASCSRCAGFRSVTFRRVLAANSLQ
jgi:Methyltransferase domain